MGMEYHHCSFKVKCNFEENFTKRKVQESIPVERVA